MRILEQAVNKINNSQIQARYNDIVEDLRKTQTRILEVSDQADQLDVMKEVDITLQSLEQFVTLSHQTVSSLYLPSNNTSSSGDYHVQSMSNVLTVSRISLSIIILRGGLRICQVVLILISFINHNMKNSVSHFTILHYNFDQFNFSPTESARKLRISFSIIFNRQKYNQKICHPSFIGETLHKMVRTIRRVGELFWQAS